MSKKKSKSSGKTAKKKSSAPPAPAKSKKSSVTTAFKKSTFQHADTALGHCNDGNLHAEVKEAFKNKNYSPELAQRAADVIESQTSGNDWLVEGLRTIN